MAKDKTPPMFQRITIYRDEGGGTDDSGQPVEDWQPFVENLFAAVEILAGRERFTVQQVVAEVDCKITLLWMKGLLPGMRALWSDPDEDRIRTFEFSSITPAPGDWNGLVINAIELLPAA